MKNPNLNWTFVKAVFVDFRQVIDRLLEILSKQSYQSALSFEMF